MKDETLLTIMVLALMVWALLWIAEKIYTGWWKPRSEWRQVINEGKVPADYSAVGRVAKALNERVISASVLDSKELEGNQASLDLLRTRVARIRVAGYDRATSDSSIGVRFRIGVARSPHPTGSGEAKQWVRGYCMGANVPDPRPYMDAA